MRKLVSTIPLADDAILIAEADSETIENLAKNSFCLECILDAGDNLNQEDTTAVDEYFLIYDYFLREFPNLPDETRHHL